MAPNFLVGVWEPRVYRITVLGLCLLHCYLEVSPVEFNRIYSQVCMHRIAALLAGNIWCFVCGAKKAASMEWRLE